MDVDFADGTKWRPHEELPRTPFDPSLSDADAGKCFAAAAVTKALSMIDGVTFDPELRNPRMERTKEKALRQAFSSGAD